VLFPFSTTINAKQFPPSVISDQSSDGDFCNYAYVCNLSGQELSLLSSQDGLGYQIKDHTGIFTAGAWPQIYFGPDRYLSFNFRDLNFLLEDTILNSNVIISYQTNEARGSSGSDYDVKVEASKDSGLSWEVMSTNIWPTIPNSYDTFEIPLPASYLDATSLNGLLVRLSVYGDDGHAGLSSVFDLVKLDVNYFNPLSNTPPVNTISVPNENQQLKDKVVFTVFVTDDFGVHEYQLDLLDENKSLITTCLQATIVPVTSLLISCEINSDNYRDGQYHLQIKTKDNAGKWTTTIRSVSFDNTPPITDLLSIFPQNDTFWKDPIIISGTSQDNLTTSFANLYFKESNTTNPWVSLTTLVNSITGSIFEWSYAWRPTQEKTYNLATSATDSAGNQETTQTISQNITYVPSSFPIISNQFGTTPAFGEITISWITQLPTSGRVVYDIISHPILNTSDSNYGYLFSSNSINLISQSTSHLITLVGLSDNTTYYYRIISTSSPTTISDEFANKTLSIASPSTNQTISSTQNFRSGIVSPENNLPLRVIRRGSPEVESDLESDQVTTKTNNVLGQTTTKKPKTWMLVLSIALSSSYILYLLFRRH
jgi:hypothetical protein